MPQLSDRVDTFMDSVIRRMTRINNQSGSHRSACHQV